MAAKKELKELIAFWVITTENCADPGFPLNGFTRGSNFQHGEKVTFVCQPGFKLTGITSTTCNDGAWSDKVPVCRGKDDSLILVTLV